MIGLRIIVNFPDAACLYAEIPAAMLNTLIDADDYCLKAYITLARTLTVHDWKEEYDPAFGVFVAKSRCGRVVDRRVLIGLISSQPQCKRCRQLRVEAVAKRRKLVASENHSRR